MSDLEKLIELMKSFGCTEISNDRYPSCLDLREYFIDSIVDECTQVTIGTGKGYSGFYGIFTFDKEGKAETYGIWK